MCYPEDHQFRLVGVNFPEVSLQDPRKVSQTALCIAAHGTNGHSIKVISALLEARADPNQIIGAPLRTDLCDYGENCRKESCTFAHRLDELGLPQKPTEQPGKTAFEVALRSVADFKKEQTAEFREIVRRLQQDTRPDLVERTIERLKHDHMALLIELWVGGFLPAPPAQEDQFFIELAQELWPKLALDLNEDVRADRWWVAFRAAEVDRQLTQLDSVVVYFTGGGVRAGRHAGQHSSAIEFRFQKLKIEL